ncbi:MAG TPA: HDOD domain-containing protein [Deltaproteobacteria bacterium]|nr:HDOD domain-containing protein [Deltaproteobacteria bacterium]HOI07407.1 HDOD domain-containing protein [Deltaproteobacteria bacterium]
MKILVVDDELVSRKKMQSIMEGIGECESAESGSEAVEAFKGAWEKWAPFDLITLDIMMPDMDGTRVLSMIRQIEEEKGIPREKKAKIFMVTSLSEKDTIISCVQTGCDDFIIKPFSRETVAKKLVNRGFKVPEAAGGGNGNARDAGSRGAFIESIINRFKRGEIDLPSLPQINMKFKELVEKGATLQNIAELLRQDAAISTKLISISNSPYYRGLTENKTLESAISRLGIEATKGTVNAIANRALYTTSNRKYTQIVEDLWEHSLSCAYATQLTAKALGLRLKEDPFTLGLLHDIGKLILIQVVGEAEKRTQAANQEEVMEMFKSLDAYHGRTGAILLKKWGFSDTYIAVSHFHDALDKTDTLTKELQVVHFANLLVKDMGFGQSEPIRVPLEETESCALLKVPPETVEDIKAKTREQIDNIKQFLE